ncbi:MAG: tetratricopeptide repeat-containing sensor histidine kinase [Microscillaceae bacterium]|jgi:signal transduction histidine kinase/predicted negative regulator of RcsB-dependent stress response|nr:tetratricopeptide repeat-containing sensor histidine kinase [Microscillaceae bacterium]
MRKFCLILSLVVTWSWVCSQTTSQLKLPPPIDSLEIARKTTNQPRKYIDLTNLLAEKYKTFSPQKSLQYAEEAHQLAQKSRYTLGVVQALVNIGEFYLDDGNYTSALSRFFQALELSRQIKSESIEAIVMNKIGVVYYFQNQYDKALEYELPVLEIQTKRQDYGQLGNTLSIISYAYTKKGNYATALQYHFRALEIREKIGDKNEIAKSYNSIGDLYVQQGNFTEALRNYEKALQTSQIGQNKKGLAIAYHNLGVVYAKLNQFQKAEDLHFKALQIKSELDIKKEIAISLLSIGNMYYWQKKFDQSRNYLQKAFELNTKLGNQEMLIMALNRLGQIYQAEKKLPKSIEYYQQALQIAQQLGQTPTLGETYRHLYQAYLLMGDNNQFAKYYKLYQALDPAQLSEGLNSLEIKAMELRYEYTKKQKEIEVLAKENQIKQLEISRQNWITYSLLALLVLFFVIIGLIYQRYQIKQRAHADLQKSNAEVLALNDRLSHSEVELQQLNHLKDKFLSIISHDLRAPLNTIMSLVDLLNTQRQLLSPEQLQMIIERLSISTHNTLNFLDNILQWLNAQTHELKPHTASLDLKSLIEEVLLFMQATAQNKGIELQFSKPESPAQAWIDANMFKTVLVNLLANALKFTHQGGLVKIGIEEQSACFCLSVADNGVGITPEQMSNLFALNKEIAPGTLGEKGVGLGLALSKEFVELNGGKLWVSSEVSKGTTFYFTVLKAEM